MDNRSDKNSHYEIKFLCDERLQRLGNWLRAAGYDTLIEATGRSDYEILRQAIDEGRYLISRDRKLMEHRRSSGTVILLPDDTLEVSIKSLSEQVPINWHFNPFMRCTVCNTELKTATEDQRKTIPKKLQQHIDEVYYCSSCEQVYWQDDHVQRMRVQLKQWHSLYNQ